MFNAVPGAKLPCSVYEYRDTKEEGASQRNAKDSDHEASHKNAAAQAWTTTGSGLSMQICAATAPTDQPPWLRPLYNVL